jgi:hypothetical protein
MGCWEIYLKIKNNKHSISKCLIFINGQSKNLNDNIINAYDNNNNNYQKTILENTFSSNSFFN